VSDHLIRKGSVYYFRRRVPADLVQAYGKSEHVRSLRTTDKREAERLVRRYDVEMDSLFETLRSAAHAAGARGHANVAHGSGSRTVTQAEIDEMEQVQEEAAREFAAPLEQQFAEHDASIEKAERRARRQAQRAAELDAALFRVLSGRTLYGPGVVPESSHPSAVEGEDRSKRPTGSKRPILTPTDGRSIHAILRLWTKEKQPDVKTVQTAERALGRFRDLMGDIPVPAVTKGIVVAFKDKLIAAGHTANTTNKTLNYMSIMFNYAVTQAWIETDPAKGVRVPVKKQAKGASRSPFSEAALNRIFSDPIYSEGARPALGAGEAAYWLPLLGLYTGARIEELCQLAPGDIKQEKYRDTKGREQTAWVMHITGTGEGQGVKNTGSERRIPIHGELLNRGFVKYVQANKNKRRVFPLLRADKYGHEAPRWSVWWHKHMRAAGAITGTDMVFHSFRHNFKDACRECGIGKELADALQGHSEGDSSGNYGGKYYPLRPMMEAMHKYGVSGVKLPA
jgi:integrase